MARKIQLVGALLLAMLNFARAGDVIDRIVATVNGHIILQSQWDDALAYEALTGGRPLHQVTEDDRKAALNRLIDQELLREQIPPASENSSDRQYHPDEQTLGARVQDVRKQFPQAETEQGWHDLLASYGFTEDELKLHIATQLEILHMVETRLTPTLQVDQKSVEDYYQQTLLPKIRASGAKEPPLAEVEPKIRELLVQQKLNDALQELLRDLHDSATIRLQVPVPPNGSQSR